MIVKTRLTVMVSDFCAVCTPSVTRATKVDAPVPVGVPLMNPAAENPNPAGNVPDARDHVLVPVPPVAVSVPNTVSLERRSATSRCDRQNCVDRDCQGLLLRLNAVSHLHGERVPVAVRVPLITPAADRVSPVGSDPVARDHVLVPVPPVAANVRE